MSSGPLARLGNKLCYKQFCFWACADIAAGNGQGWGAEPAPFFVLAATQQIQPVRTFGGQFSTTWANL